MGIYIRALRAPRLQRLVTVEARDGARSDVVCGAMSFLRKSGWQTPKIQLAQEARAKGMWSGVRMVPAVVLTDEEDQRRIVPGGDALVWPDRKEGVPLIASDGTLESARSLGRVVAVRGFVPSWAIGCPAACEAYVGRRWRDALRALAAQRWAHVDAEMLDLMVKPQEVGDGTSEVVEALKDGLVQRCGLDAQHYLTKTAATVILGLMAIEPGGVDRILDHCGATSAHTRMTLRRHIDAGLAAYHSERKVRHD